MQTRVLIVNYGMGNLHAVKNSLHRMNVTPIVSADAGEIHKADKIILPGVGHFSKAMENLTALGVIDALNEAALIKQKPVLGICLGMQLMAKHSEEGAGQGLGWFDASVVKFKPGNSLKFKVPHIGWNKLAITKENPLLKDIPGDAEFYFIHSYHLSVNNTSDILCETHYETDFVSAITKNNIWGVQFHPEKSHEAGAGLLKNFIAS
jgi:imidazole glycerol-phosphate synthase subunit HisH